VKCLEVINPTSITEAIKSPSPSIGFLVQDSRVRAAAILAMLLTDLVKSFNVGKTMNDVQVADCVKLILDDENLRSFKPDDFKLCFKRMKTGFYGISYDRIDTQVIFTALHSYLHERVLECEEMSFKSHLAHLDDVDDRIEPVNIEGQKKVVEILKAVIKETPVKKVEVPAVKKERLKPVKSDRDNYIQNCFNDFYKIWLKNPYKFPKKDPLPGLLNKEQSGGRFIEYEGKPVDEVEYASMRLKEYDKG